MPVVGIGSSLLYTIRTDREQTTPGGSMVACWSNFGMSPPQTEQPIQACSLGAAPKQPEDVEKRDKDAENSFGKTFFRAYR